MNNIVLFIILEFTNTYYFTTCNSCEALTVLYYIYSKHNPEVPLLFSDEKEIDGTKRTKVILHGFLGKGLSNTCLAIKDEFLKKEDCNVIIIDWSLNGGDYERTAMFAKIVGRHTAEQLFYIFEDYNLLHFIGLGLGGHVVSFAAKQIKSYTNGKNLVGRISAVDPDFPLFNTSDPNSRLDSSDAKSVIVYHCDGGKLGIMDPIGTVDFYINGGYGPQPNCKDMNPSYIDTLYGHLELITCSHNICRTYFINSINSERAANATKCDSFQDYSFGLCDKNAKVIFGENVELDAKGSYYVNITEDYVYDTTN